MMTTFPRAPRLIKGGLVLVEPLDGTVKKVIALQYNPDALSRTLQLQGAGGEGGDQLEALRLKGPPIETLKLEAELDLTDQLEFPEQHPSALESGILPRLSVLETIAYPSTDELRATDLLARSGAIEVAPALAPLTLFVWSQHRIIPVRITEFTIVEEAFDARLNPIRAKVSLGMRVLSVNDLGFTSRGGSLYLAYQAAKERLAAAFVPSDLETLDIGGRL
jgi:hypothetical protein